MLLKYKLADYITCIIGVGSEGGGQGGEGGSGPLNNFGVKVNIPFGPR